MGTDLGFSGRVIQAFVSTVAFVLVAACSPSGDGLEDEMQAVGEELVNSYFRPMLAAESEAGGSLCGFTRISGSPGECVDLVETIAELSPVLESLLARLESFRAQFPPNDPRDEIVIMDKLVLALQALRNSDQVLIEGWLLGDDDLWQEGWGLRKEAGPKLADFLEAAFAGYRVFWRMIPAQERLSPSRAGLALGTYNGGVFDRTRRVVKRSEPFPELPEITLRPIGVVRNGKRDEPEVGWDDVGRES